MITAILDYRRPAHRGTQTRQKPEWSEFRPLIPPSNVREQSTADGKILQPSSATRVWAYDWNRDGKLDLLVGDSVHISNPKEGLSAEEYEKQSADYEVRMQDAIKAYQSAQEEYSKVQADGETPDDDLQKRYNEAQEEYRKVYESRGEFRDEQSTGFVWLYLRKPEAQPNKPDA